MNSTYYYKIADIVIKMTCDFMYDAYHSYMKDYLIENADSYDYLFEFKRIDNINDYLKQAPIYIQDLQKYHYCQDEKGNDYCFFMHEQYIHAVTINEKNHGYCYYVSYDMLAKEVNEGNHLENFMRIEKILMNFDCMILHSCHIHYNNEAILFSAPSGTGKSTQGDLWHKNVHANIINGDRTAIRKKDNQWYAYGIPFCGTSGINLNLCAPLKCIVVLRQYHENIATKLNAQEAFRNIYSELTVNTWNQDYVNKAMDFALNLINDIPIYLYQCTKEDQAVYDLKTIIVGSE